MRLGQWPATMRRLLAVAAVASRLADGMSGSRILVIDDEPVILRALRANLAARGYDVTAVQSGEEALDQARACSPDLVILDLMLPDLSGLEVCRALRAESTTPVLVLSGHGEEHIKVRALDLGADDYLTKPFGIDELVARIRALLRRASPAPAGTSMEMIAVGTFVVDADRRQVWHDQAPLDLTRRERDILVYLLRHAGRVVTHRQLLAELWGPEYDGETHYLRVFVNRLRRKIEPDPAHPRVIVTEPGVGYRLVLDRVPAELNRDTNS
jgi:two-component system, OmpR family, KDP operon response regulator KdpE